MDIRFMLAEEIAQRINAAVLPQKCDCGWPLMERAEQRLPFCWGCTTDKRTAMEGRELLLRAKLEEKGILIPKSSSWRAVDLPNKKEDDGRPMYGPL